jgi:hypothetical protein
MHQSSTTQLRIGQRGTMLIHEVQRNRTKQHKDLLPWLDRCAAQHSASTLYGTALWSAVIQRLVDDLTGKQAKTIS